MNRIDSGEIDSYILPPTENTDIFNRSNGYYVVPTGASVTPASINCVCASTNFKWIFTGSQDGFIRKYDMLQYFQDPVPLSVNIKQGLSDSTISNSLPLVSAWESNDNGILAVHSIDVHSEAVWCVTGLENGMIKLWTVRQEEGTCVHVFHAHSLAVSALKICGGERQLLSGSWDKSIKLWSLDDGSLLHDLGSMKSQVTCISLNPVTNSSCLVTSFDGTLWIFHDLSSTPIIVSSVGTQKQNWSLAACWSRCGQKIFIGRRNETVDQVDVLTGTVNSTIRLLPDSGWVSSILMFPNNRHLLICSHDTMRLWDLEFTQPVDLQKGDVPDQVPFTTIPGHSSSMISSVIISASGGTLITASGSRGYEHFNSSNQLILYELFPKF